MMPFKNEKQSYLNGTVMVLELIGEYVFECSQNSPQICSQYLDSKILKTKKLSSYSVWIFS